jgi:hypothetical protein
MRARLLWPCLALVASACAPTTLQIETRLPPLDVDASRPEILAHTALRARLRATPHGFFRFVNAAFTEEVCRRFASLDMPQPTVTLHGDCHVEQYAVTELGRGLTDFDDSVDGPAYVDIVRFGVSLHLAARQRGWAREADWIFDGFRQGYRKALADPHVEAPLPAAARRIAESFMPDRTSSLARAEALMEGLEDRSPEIEEVRSHRVLDQVARDAGLPPHWFRVKKVGLLRIGVGSALSAKYLLRIEGPSLSDEDDVMIEAKELLDRESSSCLQVMPGPSRILAGDARLAYQPFRFPGVLHLGSKTFWLHAWTDNYQELNIQASLRTASELREIAFDVGVQLGRGHPRRLEGDAATRLRVEILRTLPEDRIEREIEALTHETLRAWRRFVLATPARP